MNRMSNHVLSISVLTCSCSASIFSPQTIWSAGLGSMFAESTPHPLGKSRALKTRGEIWSLTKCRTSNLRWIFMIISHEKSLPNLLKPPSEKTGRGQSGTREKKAWAWIGVPQARKAATAKLWAAKWGIWETWNYFASARATYAGNE